MKKKESNSNSSGPTNHLVPLGNGRYMAGGTEITARQARQLGLIERGEHLEETKRWLDGKYVPIHHQQ